MYISKVGGNKWKLVAGIVMSILGAVVLFNPFDTMIALAFYLGVGFVMAGFFYVMSAVGFRSGWYLLVGILDLLVGFILMANLGITAASLPVILALWCLTIGVVQLMGTWDIKKLGLPWGWSAIMGVVSLLFGLLILVFPLLGAITISMVLGFYILLFGILQLAEYYMSKNSYRLIVE